MSNFTGVTFAQQKVLPSDDAIIRRSILSDGILYGCQISYSGSTLTMAAGQLLICGRQIRHPSAQNWAVADATSGYARLVLRIDLTRTASKEVFEQVVDSIEYATAQDGFPALNQSDVNTTGSVYQVVACVVSLGTGGITGIVEELGACEVSGGGGLNFKVVGGTTQPASPTENMIWVNTDTDISSYTFSAAEPGDPEEGMVWVQTGTASDVSFNALKKNVITIYPISCKQYIDGAWVNVEAYIYQEGEWVQFSSTMTIVYLYNRGDTCDDLTGGYVAAGLKPAATSASAAAPTVVYNDDSMVITGSNTGTYNGGYVKTVNKIDLTDFTRLVFEGSRTGNGTAVMQVWTQIGSYINEYSVAQATIPVDATSSEIDISGLTGEHYIGFMTTKNDDGQAIIEVTSLSLNDLPM